MDRPPQSYAMPLLAIDTIVRVDEAGITTRKAIAGNEPFFSGHYPDYPIYPGVFIIEAVSQAARAYALYHRKQVRFKELRSARFLAALRPGDVLECDCKCSVEGDGSSLRVDASCRHGDVLAASVKLTFAVEGADAV